MRALEQWIWLPQEKYPKCQKTIHNPGLEFKEGNYVFAEFKKDYKFSKGIKSVNIRFSGDTAVKLYFNKKFVCRGPASAGGDFLYPYIVQPQYYATEVTLNNSDYPELLKGEVCFGAVVRMTASHLFEHSLGQGGFFLTAYVYFEDGSRHVIITDDTWDVRRLNEYTGKYSFDNTAVPDEWEKAEKLLNIWHCETSPIPPCVEIPELLGEMTVSAGESLTKAFAMDMIYAGYPVVESSGGGIVVKITCREWQEEGTQIDCNFARRGIYESSEMHSAGELIVTAENQGDEAANLRVSFVTSAFPVNVTAKTVTSDDELNKVLDVCTHTLKYCRQTLHLDSPRHCELLACTGDYYIESLMTAFSFGDQRLSAFDVRRTAELLRYRDGVMFHTTYSLIWVQMLWDTYLFTGEKSLLTDCLDALQILFDKFRSYKGENGLIENPLSFMFVDWLFPDGISTHHPPKALGQTCLNMFYFGALKTAEKIYDEIGLPSDEIKAETTTVRQAILINLYDENKKLFFEGLNTPTPENLISEWMPQNVSKRYYRKHSNILAAYFGFFSEAENRELIKRIWDDESLGQVQPYFCHFLFEAIYRNGLREEFTRELAELWKAPVKECSKGLAEGFYKPEPTYNFDHSHAWGGTPMWSIPLALSGMQILEPGMKKLRFNPSLLGYKFAAVEIPTQYGVITLKLKEGEKPEITSPKGIEIDVI